MPNDLGKRSLLGLSLAAPLLYLFRAVLSGDEALYARDVFHQYWPLRTHIVEAFNAGRLPLWDDASQGGLPLLANIHAAALYPPNFVYQWVSFPTGYGWLVALHLVVLAWGLFAWLRATGRGALGSAVAALVFSASAPVLGLTAFGPNLMGLAWVPWFAHALVRRGSFVSRVGQGAAVVALQCLCGDPMSVLFSAIVGAAVVALTVKRTPLLIIGSASAVIGVLMAGVQLLPAYGLLQQTTRAADLDKLEWSMHPIRFFELALPKLFGSFDATPAFWGTFLAIGGIKTPFSLSVYVGAAACLLALAGALQTRRALGLSLFVVGSVLALGSQFVAGPFLEHVPPFSLFRYPEKYLVLAVLGLTVLLADGLDALVEKRLSSRASGLLGLAVALGGLAWVSLTFGPSMWEPWMRSMWPNVPVEIPLESFRFATGAFTLLGAGLIGCAWVPSAQARGALVSGLVVADALISNQAVIFTTPVEMFNERPPTVDAMIEGAPQHPFRIWRDNVGLAKIQFATQTPEQRMMQRAWELLTLKSSLSTVFGLQEISGNSPVVLSRWEALLRAQPAAILTLYNTCFVIEPTKPGALVFAPMPEGAGVRQIDCLPRLFSVQRTVAVSTESEALARVGSDSFSPRTLAVIETPDQAGTHEGLDLLDVSHLEYASGHMSANVRAGSTGGFLVFGTSWARGWSVSVDGHEAPLLIVDGAIMGTPISSGAHAVSFDFHEPLLGPGAVSSVIGLLLLISAWVGRRALNEHPLVS